MAQDKAADANLKSVMSLGWAMLNETVEVSGFVSLQLGHHQE